MPKRQSDVSPISEPSPTPTDQADTFTLPSHGDAFTPPTPDQEAGLWMELRTLLDTLVARAATPADRLAADALVRRIGLDPVLNPLFLTALREAHELESIVLAGTGKADEAERIRRELASYGNLAPASDVAANRVVAQEKERLSSAWLTTNRLGEAATRAAGGLAHLRNWLPELFGLPDWCKERDSQNRIASGAGRLGCTICPDRTSQAAGELGVNPYLADSWRQLRRPEPAGPRRRFRSTSLSSPSPVSGLGQSPYPPRF